MSTPRQAYDNPFHNDERVSLPYAYSLTEADLRGLESAYQAELDTTAPLTPAPQPPPDNQQPGHAAQATPQPPPTDAADSLAPSA
jgi:hypothetical protein